MRIHGSLPINVARAYGVASRPPARTEPAATPAEPQRAEGPSRTMPAKALELVAGKVAGPVTFAPATTPVHVPEVPPAGAYQLYTRAADKIEAAVAVQIGRAVDVKA